MLNRIKSDLVNFGLRFMSVDEKIVRLFLETGPKSINEIVILPAVKIVMKKLISKLRNKRVRGRVYNGLLNGVNVSIIRSLVGCPNCATAMECLKRCNTKIVVRVDFCGGIDNENNKINVGDTLIPRIAYCGDGTSPHYIIKHPELLNQLESISNPISKVNDIKAGNQMVFITKPNDQLRELLFNEAKSKNPHQVREVDFWTTDALFCETDEFINSLKSINVLGIDMENSILFLLGKLFNIKTASILSVSDVPTSKYDIFKTNEIHPNLEKGINNAIEILISSLPKIKTALK
ncbi:MAG: hypothetical protein EU529_09115 [Promethearchaeota archaeon]|nr:MAG: hypothetical protein EU529_09115 [Candidatus Lokiarchaeota archaeon]